MTGEDMRRVERWTRVGVSACLLAAGGCSTASKPTEPTGSNGNGNGGNSNSSDVTVSVILHGATGNETLEAFAVASGTVPRASATESQLTFYDNYNGPGQDDTVQLSVPKGQSVSLFAIETEDYWDDNSTTYYNPTPNDTAIASSGIEFVSWSSPCGSPSFGDCQLTNLQSNTQVTATYRMLKSLVVQAIGAGALIRTIQTRPRLTIGQPVVSNPINGITDTTGVFTDSAYAVQYEVALFSGSQITFVATELPGTGFTVNFDSWGGLCTTSVGHTCIVKWPTAPGGSFDYNGSPPGPSPQAKFQWYKCTFDAEPQAAGGADNTAPGWSCNLQSP